MQNLYILDHMERANMLNIRNMCLTFSLLWILYGTCLCQSSETPCVPVSPDYIQPEDGESINYPSVPDNIRDGIQAILPDYEFHCSGVVTEITVHATQSQDDSDFVLQIWRPVGKGVFEILWANTYPTQAVFERTRFDTLRWRNPIGVPVIPGDVLGFFIGRSKNPLQLLHSNSLTDPTAPTSTVFYVRNVDEPLCNISLCDNSVQSFVNTAPFITPTLETRETSLIETAQDALRLSRIIMSCTTSSFISCPSIQRTQVFQTMPETSPVSEATIPPILSMSSASSYSTPSPVSPTPLSTTEVPVSGTPPSLTTTSDSMSNGDSTTATDNSSTILSGTRDITEEISTDPDGLIVDISPEAIAFIVIGILLFVILIVLVFVLIACLRTKGTKVEQSSNLLAPSQRQPDVESVDSRTTVCTRLGASTSVEHSVSSNETCSVHACSSRNTPSRTSHHYANGEISREGVFSSFSPKYMNTNRHPLSHSASHGHLRSDRVMSTSAILEGRVSIPTPFHQMRSRARSVEPSAKLCAISKSDIPPREEHRGKQLPPVPARSRGNGSPHKANPKPSRPYSVLEASGDYDDPIPPSERNRVQSCGAWVDANVHGRNARLVMAHDYADPDDPDNNEAWQSVSERFGYDKLLPRDESFNFNQGLNNDSRVPCPQIHGIVDSIDDHSYSDPDGPSYNSMERRGSNCIYTYVPTEDQRRQLLSNGGHYEIQEDFLDQQPFLAYDHLKFFEEREIYWAPATTESGLYTQLYENKYREIPRNQIRVLRRIGSGNFGTVSMGVWINGEESEQVEVAIKTVKTTTDLERIKLLQEAAIMGQFAHTNVVRLLGVVTVGEPVLILLEYMTRGDLRSFLPKLHPKHSRRELPDILPTLFIKFSKDIANGMSYLSKKFFVHRDLAARNILLTHDLTCKIGDFGMARDIENDYYKSHGGIIPVKWTAPEALNYNKFSTASDVWSFGMVLFEIWSLGEKPFNELTNPIVIALVSSKHCQPPPPGCPRAIYHLMVECWNPDASKRPTFDSIYTYLDSPLESLTYWQPSDKIAGKHAHVLGAPLNEANNLYLQLQRTYQKPLISLSQ